MLARMLLLFIFLASTSQVHAQKGGRVALLIGNASYDNAGLLANPKNDVELVADSARKAGFGTVVVKNDMGIRAFQQALRDFRAKADGAQVAMVYYAGHGVEASGKNWLIPTDAGLVNDRDLPYEAISLDQVMEAIEGATLRMVILDACRNNPFGRSWRTSARSVGRGLGGVEVDDVLVIYAAAPGQVAADGSGKNSPFAVSLARRLAEPGLPIQMLGGTIRDDVLEATGGSQRPFVSASITGKAYYLAQGLEANVASNQSQLSAADMLAREAPITPVVATGAVVATTQLTSPLDQAKNTLLGRWKTTTGKGFFPYVSNCFRYVEIVDLSAHSITIMQYNNGPGKKSYADNLGSVSGTSVETRRTFGSSTIYSVDNDILTVTSRDPILPDMRCRYFRAPVGGPEPPVVQ